MRELKISVFILMIQVTYVSSWCADSAGDINTLETRIDSLIQRGNRFSAGSPGCAVAVFQNDRIVFSKGYGMANLETKTPITPSTTFNLCSMSKQFTAACILLLEQEGKLSLDDEIHKYLPELAAFSKPITIRNLIHHTSGIWSSDWLLIFSGHSLSDPINTRNVFDILSRCHTLNFEPGEEHAYSNSNYVLLGEIVSRVSGKSLADFARERIFRPLGMKETFIHDKLDQPARNEAVGYVRSHEGTWIPAGTRNNTCVGDNNVFSTVIDLGRWANNFREQKVGGPSFTENMQTRGVLNNGKPIDYAFGLDISSAGGLPIVFHQGADPGFNTFMIRLPEENLSVVCLCNHQISSTRIARSIVELVLGRNIFSSPEEITLPADSTTKVEISPSALSLYTGKFSTDKDFVINITLQDNVLKARATGQPELGLEPETDSLFHLVELPKIKISFHGIDRGPATHIIVYQNGETRLNRFVEKASSPEWLGSFAGEYYSDELAVTYRVERFSDKLVLHSPIVDSFTRNLGVTGIDTLAHSGGDTFSLSPIPVVFKRNVQGRVTGFMLSVTRVRNLSFIRR